MVVRSAILALLCSLALGFATETGSLAYRAHELYATGHYADAMNLLKKGLESSAKEADVQGESRILLDMAQVQFHAYEFTSAEELLALVREKYLNTQARLAQLRLRMLLAEYQGKFDVSRALFLDQRPLWSDEKAQDQERGLVILEGAVANAAPGGDQAKVDPWLKEATDLLDDEAPGVLLLARAKIADQHKNVSEAKELYSKSLTYAQKSQRSWTSGQILLRLGFLAQGEGNKDEAADNLLRATKLYLELELDRPFLVAAKAYLALVPDDSIISHEVMLAKMRLHDPK